MRRKALTILAITVLCSAAKGDLIQDVLELDVVSEGTYPTTGAPIIVEHAYGLNLRKGFLSERVLRRMKPAGIYAQIQHSSHIGNLRSGKLDESLRFRPLLLIEAEGKNGSSTVDLEVALITYTRQGDKYTPVRTWHSRTSIGPIPTKYLKSTLTQSLRAKTDELVRSHGNTLRKKRKKPGKTSSYHAHWIDRNHRRSSLRIGAMAGTPTRYAQPYLGYWGSRKTPLVAGISGMFYSLERRGMQAELAWAFDNEGRVFHAIGMGLMLANETKDTVTSQKKDQFGRTFEESVDHTDRLVPVVGPTYLFDWNRFRLQGGVGFGKGGERILVRPMVQIGLTLDLRL